MRKTARILAYPKPPHVQVFGVENLTQYRYGLNESRFCKICGVHIDNSIVTPPEHMMADWPIQRKEAFHKFRQVTPVTLRVLDGVEWKGQPGEIGGDEVPGKVKVTRENGKDRPAPSKYDF